ncbi:sugar phosphate isomerase/epimerase family protein [Pararhodonellum marinum]|uniref:sugar phosphate isomerase/epimerase family protein n=1 Tax=Pararhodonellum marinum TaxID=2755358 RepID=UPI00188F8CFF|nr:sugar phosphate isomerase/epimerase [Pararhodonellum marinum]
MQKRREFCKKSLAGVLGLNFAKPLHSLASAYSQDHIGIITNTVGNEMKEDYRATLWELAQIGYKCIEGGVPEGIAPNEYKNLLKGLGLRSVATGSSMGNLRKELDHYLRIAELLEAEYLVCYYPWLSSATDLQTPEIMETIDNINQMGKQVKDAGFRFAWHNHDKEFAEVGGKLVFDTMMEHINPDYATVELDWYWVVKGGVDPVDLFEKYPSRFEISHIKDMNNNRDEGISCVGQGIMDFKPIFDAAKTGGVKYYIVENERAVKGIDCARVSYSTISRHLGL